MGRGKVGTGEQKSGRRKVMPLTFLRPLFFLSVLTFPRPTFAPGQIRRDGVNVLLANQPVVHLGLGKQKRVVTTSKLVQGGGS